MQGNAVVSHLLEASLDGCIEAYLGLALELGWMTASISETWSSSLRRRASSARSCASAVDVNA